MTGDVKIKAGFVRSDDQVVLVLREKGNPTTALASTAYCSLEQWG